MNTSRFVGLLSLWVGIFCGLAAVDGNDVYNIGIGIADITGPAAEINMMGYAKFSQVTAGIHLRQYSRAFIFSDNDTSVVFVNVDSTMGSQLVTLEVVKKLKEKFGDLYTEQNVALSTTHTHSAPAGFLQYVLPSITSQGFIHQTFNAQVQGIVLSIERAHNNTKSGYVYWNRGDLYNTSINRSPSAYENNPELEKGRYETNVDTDMLLLKLTDINNKPIGMINWFAVHCTSMNNTNSLISGDNKGYAAQLFERDMNKNALPGKGAFVAAFAQANEGDVSPNTKGPKCIDTGLPCDFNTSTCGGKTEKCIAFGPGNDMFESTQIIGERQYNKAMELFKSAKNRISGPVSHIHQYVDMTNVQIYLPEQNTTVTTCKPAMGYSFAAGTIDGPGDFDFKQGTKSPSAFWNLVRNVLHHPTKSTEECHSPKPILFDTGEMSFPYPWQPDILPSQILKIGQLAILAVPGEFTTMSGRRLREAVKQTFDKYSKPAANDTLITISGLSNAYSHYIATFEEYQVQRYEAASTIYGPHTLRAHIQQYQTLAKHLAQKKFLPPGPPPLNLLSRQISLKAGVFYDGTPFRKKFGQVVTDVNKSYPVNSTVSVTFVSGHPRNDLQLENTFLTVEKFDSGSSSWKVIATDSSWETKFRWVRTNTFLGESQVVVSWDIPPFTKPGKYRIQHFGHSKSIFQKISPYNGTSSTFQVES